MSWQREMYKTQERLQEYIRDLEDQRNFLLSAMKDIAAGLISRSDPSDWSYSTKLQMSASRALQAAAKKRLRQP